MKFDPTHKKSIEEIAMGFIDIGNEAMCKPIRVLTEARGYDTSKHVLSCFGGAGGQHACAIAKALGMSKIFIHRYTQIFGGSQRLNGDDFVSSILLVTFETGRTSTSFHHVRLT